VLAADLQRGYDAQQQASFVDAGPGPGAALTQPTLTPEVKLAISEEVKRQVTDERDASGRPAGVVTVNVEPDVLREKIFLVSSSLDVVSVDDPAKACTLSGGDVIERTPRQPVTDDGRVMVDVMSSKSGGCPEEFAARLDLTQLQDMLNEFRAELSEGMGNLASNEGKGIPAGPPAAPRRTPDGQPLGTAGASQAALLQEANKSEADIQSAVGTWQ